MSLGEVLDRTFNLYKGYFWLFAGISALPYLLIFIIQMATSTVRYASGGGGAKAPVGTHPAVVPSAGYLSGIFGGLLIFIVVYLILIAIVHAATVFAVSDLYLGKPASIREAFRRVRGKVPTLVGVGILNALIVGAGFILLIIPGIIFACRVAVAVPAAMLEGESASAAVGRSWELTKDFTGEIFLIGLLVAVMSWIVSAIFQVPFMFMAGSITKPHQLPFGLAVLQHLGSFIAQVLVGPIGTIAYSLMYYNLRVRKEAFDLQHLMASLEPSSPPDAQLPGAPSTA